MSYEIIKQLKISEAEKLVTITSASNNCWPRTYEQYHSKEFFDPLFEEGGMEAVEKYVLKSYLGGMMQGGNNKYAKASEKAQILFPKEHKELFTGIIDTYTKWHEAFKADPSAPAKYYDSHQRIMECEEADALTEKQLDLLYKALHTRMTKQDKYVIKFIDGTYIGKTTKRRSAVEATIEKAKRFTQLEAGKIKERYSSYQLEIVKV